MRYPTLTHHVRPCVGRPGEFVAYSRLGGRVLRCNGLIAARSLAEAESRWKKSVYRHLLNEVSARNRTEKVN